MKVVVMDDEGHIVSLPQAEDIPTWLKKHRADNNLSMQEIGNQLGVTKQAVYSWESGIAVPTAENLAKLVGMFGEPPTAKKKNKKSKMDAINDLLKPHAKNVSG